MAMGRRGRGRSWRRRRCAVRQSSARRGATSDERDGFAVRGRAAAHCCRASRSLQYMSCAHRARRCSPAPRVHPVCACALRVRRSMPASVRVALVRAPVLCVGCARAVCRRPATVGPDRARRHRIVRHPLGNVVDIAGVRRPVLYAGDVHACVVALASPMLALRAPAMYALAVHAFVSARLRFPCSRCVLLLCVPLLCVPALCAFVWCVVCLCSARLYRAAALVDVADTTPLVDPGDLTCPSGDLTHAPVP